MSFRKFFVLVIFCSLLFLGPINHSWPWWLAIRIGYLIIIPLLIWFLLKWVWDWWQPSLKIENVLERILSGFVCGVLILFAIFEALSDTHIGNTKWIQTRDGMEAVGDDIILSGPDWFGVFVFTILAICVFWFGVLKKGFKKLRKF